MYSPFSVVCKSNNFKTDAHVRFFGAVWNLFYFFFFISNTYRAIILIDRQRTTESQCVFIDMDVYLHYPYVLLFRAREIIVHAWISTEQPKVSGVYLRTVRFSILKYCWMMQNLWTTDYPVCIVFHLKCILKRRRLQVLTFIKMSLVISGRYCYRHVFFFSNLSTFLCQKQKINKY